MGRRSSVSRPVFVLTNRGRERIDKQGGTSFTFDTDGIESALDQAHEAAGDKTISVAGGAETMQQFVAAGLVDEVQLHVAPLLLGRGKRLLDQLGKEIDLERMRVVDSPGVTHLKYRVLK